jgi:putative DNA primase/helicase
VPNFGRSSRSLATTACGKLHLLAGAPGTGKTTIALSIAATITAGACWPDGSTVASGDVLMWSGEDGIADTLFPRLLVAGVNPARMHFVDRTHENGEARPFNPATDMTMLMQAARGLPNLKLITMGRRLVTAGSEATLDRDGQP